MVALTLVVALVNLVLLGAVHGVFFAYSNSVVPGLDRVDAEQAAAAMRGLNVVIVNPRFLATFAGPLLTAAATGFLLLGLDETTPALLCLAAAAVYLLGCLAVTGRVNVPMNNALEAGSLGWAEFAPRWRRWNTVRTVSSMVALVLCGMALYLWHR
ncbi:anthrone oxygenase family protein [Actinophytocola sp. KF-1]